MPTTELIAQDPDYGEMICSCEEVTKAEILQAIHNPLGHLLLVFWSMLSGKLMMNSRCLGIRAFMVGSPYNSLDFDC